MAPCEVETSQSVSDSLGHGPLLCRKPIISILRVKGAEVVDGDGNVVILKGVIFVFMPQDTG